MSIRGIKSEIEYVRKSMKELKSIISEIDDNLELEAAFDALDSNLDDLVDECEDVISSIDEALSGLQEI